MKETQVFEIQNVLHRANLIYFTWNDIGGTLSTSIKTGSFYEGTVAEFSDGDFKHAKLYNYSIERVVGGDRRGCDCAADIGVCRAEKQGKSTPVACNDDDCR